MCSRSSAATTRRASGRAERSSERSARHRSSCARCHHPRGGAVRAMTQLAASPRDIELPELPDHYNAATTYVDAHRDTRADQVAIRCQGNTVTYGELGANLDRA